MRFADHSPSSAWEAVPLCGSAHHFIWVWYKPPAAAHGLLFSIPDEAYRDPARTTVLSIRNLLRSVEIPLDQILHWTYCNRTHVPENVDDHTLNEPLPPSGPADRTITVVLKPLVMPGSNPAMPTTNVTLAPTTIVLPIFSRMEAAWTASQLIEQQSEDTARQLSAMIGRVGGMNRDLNFDEARFSDQGDKNEWTDARRWLREALAKLSRYQREHQVSVTVSDNKREWCEMIHEKYVVPRIHFEGIEQADLDFEARRRALQTLHNNMKSALKYASEEAVRRAQRVLTRIAGKVRAAQTKRM